jgi:hypothetical protein
MASEPSPLYHFRALAPSYPLRCRRGTTPTDNPPDPRNGHTQTTAPPTPPSARLVSRGPNSPSLVCFGLSRL